MPTHCHMSLLGSSRLLGSLRAAARRARADQTLIACQRGGQTTLRFANGRFHQNFHAESVEVWVKAACDGHVGISTTNAVSPEALRHAVDAAITIAKTGGHRHRTGFHAGPGRALPRLATYVGTTVQRPIAATMHAIHDEWRRVERAGYALAGSFTTGYDELAVVGSRGLACYQPFTVAGVKFVATRGKATGFAAATSRDIRQVDIPGVAERAVRVAQANASPRDLAVGRYDVLLEPEAVSELLEWLGYIAFGAKALAERTSCLAGRLGDAIMGSLASIADDALDPTGLAVPFDYEGWPKQRVPLVVRGIATGVVYDSHYGKLYDRASTGHAMPYDETEGPLPMHLVMAAGSTPRAGMERQLRDGLVINRFHYVNGLLDTRQALMTGLTRDGTFLVRKGKIVGSVRNLRFTQSILEAFSRIEHVSRERRLIADPGSGLGSSLCPALLIRGFTFTGKTA